MDDTPAPRAGAGRRLLLLAMLLCATTILAALSFPVRAERLGELTQQRATGLYQAVRNRILGPARVGLQVGHLDAALHPEELAGLRTSTGAEVAGLAEVAVNAAIARALEARLGRRGIAVDLLPATVPPHYRADLVIAIHADSSGDNERRGYKSAVFRGRRNSWDERLKSRIDNAYLSSTGLPDDEANVSGDMLGYYAFNRRYRHSLALSTPAVIVELGYLSHPEDRALLLEPDLVAEPLEQGIVEFLALRGRLQER